LQAGAGAAAGVGTLTEPLSAQRRQLTGIILKIQELVPKNANPDGKMPDCTHLRPEPATVMLPGRL
jgi:hypothetical protein